MQHPAKNTSTFDFLNYLPSSISVELQKLPEKTQELFRKEYTRKQKNTVITYAAHFVAGISYGYLDKWGKQLFFWASFGGMGVWWLINCIRIPSMVNSRNKKMAKELLEWVKTQHQEVTIKMVPRTIEKTVYDPSRIELDHMKEGFLLDFETNTWTVVGVGQFDWERGDSQLHYTLLSGVKYKFLWVNVGLSSSVSVLLEPINPFRIHESIEQFFSNEQFSQSTLEFERGKYYREEVKQGMIFENINQKDSVFKAVKVMRVVFMDDERKDFIVIDKYPSGSLKAYSGYLVTKEYFRDILPYEKGTL